jgi:hypothetical protein
MAYINVDEFKRKLIDEKNFFPAIVARALDEMPTADVVPRAEVERLLEDIIEGLAAEQTKEGQKADSAWESQDTLSYEVFGYAEDKLETIVLALTLLKKKYIGDKR